MMGATDGRRSGGGVQSQKKPEAASRFCEGLGCRDERLLFILIRRRFAFGAFVAVSRPDFRTGSFTKQRPQSCVIEAGKNAAG